MISVPTPSLRVPPPLTVCSRTSRYNSLPHVLQSALIGRTVTTSMTHARYVCSNDNSTASTLSSPHGVAAALGDV